MGNVFWFWSPFSNPCVVIHFVASCALYAVVTVTVLTKKILWARARTPAAFTLPIDMNLLTYLFFTNINHDPNRPGTQIALALSYMRDVGAPVRHRVSPGAQRPQPAHNLRITSYFRVDVNDVDLVTSLGNPSHSRDSLWTPYGLRYLSQRVHTTTTWYTRHVQTCRGADRSRVVSDTW